VIKIYMFVLFNLVYLMGFGGVMTLLGTSSTISVIIGVLLLAGYPMIYILGLKKFKYWESVKGHIKHFLDVMNGDL